MSTRTTVLALMGVGLLALAAIATPVLAQSGDAASDRRQAAQEKADERREAAQEKAEARREAAEHRGNVTEERCIARHGNQSLNESDERKCMQHGEFAEKAFMARRAAHALLGAINATERQWARLNATEAELQAKLAAGDLSANETERIEHRLEKIDAKQERLADRLEALKERLAKLHERWAAVREHVEERRGRQHGDDQDDASESSSESMISSSSSSSAPA